MRTVAFKNLNEIQNLCINPNIDDSIQIKSFNKQAKS